MPRHHLAHSIAGGSGVGTYGFASRPAGEVGCLSGRSRAIPRQHESDGRREHGADRCAADDMPAQLVICDPYGNGDLII